jgi:hypothetical protein
MPDDHNELTQVVEEIHQTTKSKDEEIELLDKLSFPWSTLLSLEILNKAVPHGG